MARKCGLCRQEGHTRTTCQDAGTEQITCNQCRNEFSATEGSGAVFCSKTCFEYNRDGKTGSPWKPAARTCACGEITTRGAFPGRHEADECGDHVRLISTDGEDLTEAYSPQEPFTDDPFTTPTKAEEYNGEDAHPDDPDESPTHTHTYAWYDDDNGHSGSFCACGQEEPEPVTDHRKWCTRCKLLGHYSADCTTAVLSGGVVSVPVSPGVGMVSVPVVTDNACIAADGYAPHVFEWNKWVSASQCVACGEDNPEQPENEGQDCPGCGHWTHNDSGRCEDCTLEMAAVRRNEPDPFESPTQPAEKLNVSGQPSPRYEWYGKQNRGYLVKLPDTGDFRRHKNGKPKGLTRATTFNKAATDQNSLTDWAKRNVLIGASKRPDLVAKAHGLTHEDNRDQLMKLVAELETTAGAKVSADVGTLIHELTERWDAGVLDFSHVPAAYLPLLRKYQSALDEAGLRPVAGLIERTTYIPQFGGVVGTLDRVYYHEPSGRYVIGDVKTGKTLEYGMDEIETQEWIYAHGVNNAGVYDWNEDEWEAPEMAVTAHHGAKSDRLTVSEEWGVVVHMPVQGDDAGKVTLVRADLQRGKRHAEVCHDVRVQRANKPKPEAWTGEELKAPEKRTHGLSCEWWADGFSKVSDRDQAAFLWQEAYDAGVPPEEMEKLKEIADARLAELAGLPEPVGPMTPELWEQCFSSVESVKEAGAAWEEARKAGVEPMELNRLVQLAQQRLRELGVTG